MTTQKYFNYKIKPLKVIIFTLVILVVSSNPAVVLAGTPYTPFWSHKGTPGQFSSAQQACVNAYKTAGRTRDITGVDYRGIAPSSATVAYCLPQYNATYLVSRQCRKSHRFKKGACIPNNQFQTPLIVDSSNSGEPNQCSGNPISLNGQSKYQHEVDFVSNRGVFPLSVGRYYNGSIQQSGSWRMGYLSHIETSHDIIAGEFEPGIPTITIVRLWDGKTEIFWGLGPFVSAININGNRIVAVVNEVTGTVDYMAYSGSDGLEYRYTATSPNKYFLSEVVHPSGEYHRLEYLDASTGTISAIVHSNGDRLQFSDHMDLFPGKIRFNNTEILNYTFTDNGLFETVTFVSPNSLENHSYSYSYSESHSTLLSGITDETGAVYSTWRYFSPETYYAGNNITNRDVRIISERGEGKERTSVVFSNAINRVTNESFLKAISTNAFGKETTYRYQAVDNVYSKTLQLVSVEGEATSNCIASNSSYTYDAPSSTV